MGIQPGDVLVAINGHEIIDVLDYRFFGYDGDPELVLESPAGHRRTLRVPKEEGDDLGLNFDTYLMDEPRPCSNFCLFCFVDQMAPGCRETLYFKDDDARLSFLMGNYITLTNLSDREAQRIIDLRISPINVSVHATDPKLRCTLLGNKRADKSLELMRRFGQAGIVMNGQIVLCPGFNDGAQLQRTMEDMAAWGFASCSIVPVGLTKYRQGLAKLRPVDREEAAAVIDQVEAFACIPVRYLFWEGDDEFPAQANMLFDASATDYIHGESILTIGSYGLSRLAELAGLPLARGTFSTP